MGGCVYTGCYVASAVWPIVHGTLIYLVSGCRLARAGLENVEYIVAEESRIASDILQEASARSPSVIGAPQPAPSRAAL